MSGAVAGALCCHVWFWNQGKADDESEDCDNECCHVWFWNQGKA